MSKIIKLVQGDNRPYIRLTLKDVDNEAINLTGATVRVYFREAGAEEILSTLTCSIVGSPTNGVVVFNFPGNTLNVEQGIYEGEVEIDFGGEIQTVYDILRFNVRDQFA
jgi:hypothetical protein